MTKELKIFLLGVGLPAVILAAAGLRVVQLEYRRSQWLRMRQEERERREMARSARNMFTQSATPPGAPYAPYYRNPERQAKRRDGGGPAKPGERRQRPHLLRVFSEQGGPQDMPSSERTVWLVGCLLGLAFLSLVAGGWILARAARRAREDALRKTDFLSNVSHEFKTPLTTICLCAELAQDEGLGAERRMKALRSIAAEAERLKGLVLNALDFSRLEKGRRNFQVAECDMSRLVREAGESMSERFPHGLSLPSSECAALADPSALKQIAVILLDNAAKYAAKGGPVDVAAFGAGENGCRRPRLVVSDRGPGLSAYGRRHAFERFWRGDDATTAETGGSGLGLAIAKHLAEGMGGRISVAPRDGGGLSFTLELRACRQDAKTEDSV